jgi:RNase P/RNase MRP subunit POP5
VDNDGGWVGKSHRVTWRITKLRMSGNVKKSSEKMMEDNQAQNDQKC